LEPSLANPLKEPVESDALGVDRSGAKESKVLRVMLRSPRSYFQGERND
jgi:hypothetical protein